MLEKLYVFHVHIPYRIRTYIYAEYIFIFFIFELCRCARKSGKHFHFSHISRSSARLSLLRFFSCFSLYSFFFLSFGQGLGREGGTRTRADGGGGRIFVNSSSTQSVLCFVRNLASQYNFVFELIELSCFFISYIRTYILYNRI